MPRPQWVRGKRIHYAARAPVAITQSPSYCPRCTTKRGVYIVTSTREFVTCKRCKRYGSIQTLSKTVMNSRKGA